MIFALNVLVMIKELSMLVNNILVNCLYTFIFSIIVLLNCLRIGQLHLKTKQKIWM